jgi:hypothetical protein
MTKSQYLCLGLLVLSLLLVPTFASATCSAPSTAGVKICAPANGQIANYPAEITASAVGNASITKMAVYVDNERIYFGAGSQVDVKDSSIKSGSHRLTVRAWDASGATYSAASTFNVVSSASSTCKPGSPGVRFCSPANGSIQPMNDIQVVAGATGNGSKITRLKIYWGSFLVADTTSSTVTVSAGDGPGKQTMTAKAWDAAGHTYTASTTFTTYYDGVCSPKYCSAGVGIQSPADNSTIGTSFHLSANVNENPAPITAMKAYIDGQVVAQSGGSILSAEVSTSSGSHRLTVQAWDTAGNLYRTVYSITAR